MATRSPHLVQCRVVRDKRARGAVEEVTGKKYIENRKWKLVLVLVFPFTLGMNHRENAAIYQ